MRRLLDALWGALQIGVHLLFGPVLHRWRARWGATDEEVRCPMAGDELAPHPTWSWTRAITIDAPPAAVWPWLVQLGHRRGGFYGSEGLQKLVESGIHRVRETRPEPQQLHVGDMIRMHPAGFGAVVSVIERERLLVFGASLGGDGSRATWAFYLVMTPTGATRLLERGRYQPGGGLRAKIGWGPYLTDPIGFVMSKQMLRTIKHLAEAQPIPRRENIGSGPSLAWHPTEDVRRMRCENGAQEGRMTTAFSSPTITLPPTGTPRDHAHGVGPSPKTRASGG